jgi:hypothetical protein
MSVRYDFSCTEGHDFTLWSDQARMCPTCGSEFLKRIFIEPPMINTPRTGAVDRIVRHELESRGITNIQGTGHEGDRDKVTLKTTEAQLKADKIMRDFPQMKDKNDIATIDQAVKMKWSNIGVKGVINSGIPTNSALTGAIPKGTVFKDGKLVATGPQGDNAFRANDTKLVQRRAIKDPENLQVKR